MLPIVPYINWTNSCCYDLQGTFARTVYSFIAILLYGFKLIGKSRSDNYAFHNVRLRQKLDVAFLALNIYLIYKSLVFVI